MNIFMIAAITAALIVVIAITLTGYVKAAPDEAIIISGIKKRKRFLIGRAGIKIPFFERADVLFLGLIPIDVKTSSSVPTANYINIMVDAIVNIKISTDEAKLEQATKNFLNLCPQDIGVIAREVLEGNMREIVGKMSLQEMVNDRQKFAELVKNNAEPDLAAMGLDIISFNVQNFTDDESVIVNLGIDNIEQIRKSAQIARAEAERDIVMAQANANSQANEAKVKAAQEIAERENQLIIKQAELKKQSDTKQAEANAAGEIQKQEQRKTIEENTVKAEIAKQQQLITLKEKEVEVVEQSLNAEIKKKAEAEKFEAQQKADAELYTRQKAAEAAAYEEKQKADVLKIQADAAKYSAQQEAEGIKVKGEAEAEAIKLKALAEAEGIKAKVLSEAEGIDKKAEAMKKMGEAAILEMYFNALPEVAKNLAEPLSKVEKIVMYGDGNNTKMMKDIIGTANQVLDGASEAVGFDMKSIVGGFLGGKMANKDT
ncbi:flotillin family protein [Treponema putidum]|uniref:flotillin family protein n=1 Tax=Treponema putidum TaxID=221027 RepID=UPI002104E6BB|nr:flotillin family protein [Treponema putidum]UTY30508.1 flotillin family protein [Treponema putidum]